MSIVSTPALSFLLIMINAAIALVVLRWVDRRWPYLAAIKVPARTVRWSAVITAVLTLVWVASSLVIFSQVTAQVGEQVRVATIQTGRQNTTFNTEIVPTVEIGRADSPMNVALREQLVPMTREAANQGAELVVWPEEGISYDVRNDDGDWIRELAQANDVTIVAIAVNWAPRSPGSAGPSSDSWWFWA